jgi:prophage regulatory protein
MGELPTIGFLRLSQIIGDSKANPPIAALIPIKKSCWWAGCKSGRFPSPIKLGPRVTVWRVEDIVAFIDAYKKSTLSVSKS